MTAKITILEILDFEFHNFIEKRNIVDLPNDQELEEMMEIIHQKHKSKMRKYKFTLETFKKNFDRILTIYWRMKNEPDWYRKQVEHLRSLPQHEQRTKPWYDQRNKMITASSYGTAIGLNSYSQTARIDMLGSKCGVPDSFTGNEYTIWGTMYEQVATSIYERRNNVEIIEFGLLDHQNGISYLGCSPDGATADGIMLEIKVPPKRVITGYISDCYYAQVQGQLECCDLDVCDFLECKVEEYKDKKEYDADKEFTDECGIVLIFEDNIGKQSYKYSEFFLKGKLADEWIKKTIKEVESQKNGVKYAGRRFWKIVTYLVTRFYRNKEWFGKALVDLTKFWEEVNELRKHPNPKKRIEEMKRNAVCCDQEEIDEILKNGDEDRMQDKRFTNAYSSGMLLSSDYLFDDEPMNIDGFEEEVVESPTVKIDDYPFDDSPKEPVKTKIVLKKKPATKTKSSYQKAFADDFYPF